MKRMSWIVMFFVLTALLTGCSPAGPEDASEPADQEIDEPAETEVPGEQESEPAAPENSQVQPAHQNPDYTVSFSGGSVTLFAYENQMDLESVFGVPLREETEVLGVSADTFSGSFMKHYEYEESALTLFSPKGDGQAFYLLSLTSSRQDLVTGRGISIGDELAALQEAYPELIRSLDGTTGLDGRYEVLFEGETYTYLHFFIENGIITEIRLFHEFA
jgi:hypothetical protein